MTAQIPNIANLVLTDILVAVLRLPEMSWLGGKQVWFIPSYVHKAIKKHLYNTVCSTLKYLLNNSSNKIVSLDFLVVLIICFGVM